MRTSLETLIEAAKQLTNEEREKLVAALDRRLEPETTHHITEMRGLGKDLWQGVDPQEYLNTERQTWEN